MKMDKSVLRTLHHRENVRVVGENVETVGQRPYSRISQKRKRRNVKARLRYGQIMTISPRAPSPSDLQYGRDQATGSDCLADMAVALHSRAPFPELHFLQL